jgi:RimJ/RimL family protein N-acetyltransferase
VIETERVILRPWRDEDRDAFLAMGQSSNVMKYLGGVQSCEQVDEAIARVQACQEAHGHCFWAMERKADGTYLGFCGLKIGNVGSIIDEIEIGWRLREDAWGQGFAKEAAIACLVWAWTNLEAQRVVAITVPGNKASWGLMERLGMTRRHDLDFGHPHFAEDHPLHRHITYVMERPG